MEDKCNPWGVTRCCKKTGHLARFLTTKIHELLHLQLSSYCGCSSFNHSLKAVKAVCELHIELLGYFDSSMSYELGSGEVLCPEVNFYRCYYLKGQLVVKFQLRYLHGFGHPVPAVGKVSDLVLKTKVCM
jgi:hypothetical protein